MEDVLFNGAIQRFGEGVSTPKLKEVIVSDDDYRAIEEGMTKCSKFERDAAVRVGRLPVPQPDELGEDIEKLETWRVLVIGRRNAIRAARAGISSIPDAAEEAMLRQPILRQHHPNLTCSKNSTVEFHPLVAT